MRILLAALLLAFTPTLALGQFTEKKEPAQKGSKLGREVTERIKVGIIAKAGNGNYFNIVATAPVPIDWPEQKVKIVKEDVSAAVKSLTYRSLTGGGGVKQMVVEIPQLTAGQEAQALITFEVIRSALTAPTDVDIYSVPKKLDRQLLINTGPSPYIESRHPRIVAAAKEAVAEAESDWQRVEAIYDWVRDHVIYKHCELKGAARALHDKEGDMDELTSLFVGMCRAQKIPARTVFVSGGCYAEFYLEDDDGEGHWFPCNPAGARSFGAIDDVHPILQKGDNFKNPERPRERQRFVTEYFNASGRGGSPQVQFVSTLVAE